MNRRSWGFAVCALVVRRVACGDVDHGGDQGCPLIIGYGGGEHEEFRRQSMEFAAAWRAHGFACPECDLPGQNHFDVAQQFNNPDSPILKAMFAMIR